MQRNFENMTKDEIAIERIKMFEPSEGYHLAFSGGKDSIVLYHLAQRSGVKFQPIYNWTGIDPPELKAFIKQQYPNIWILPPEITIWKLIERKQSLPTRISRFCCGYLKEKQNYLINSKVILTGVRWQESVKRRQRRLFETCHIDKLKHYLHPIIDWSDNEVWQYIKLHNIAYCKLYNEGFRRLGCVLCPMASKKITQMEMERWPKLALAWRHAVDRLFENGPFHGFKSSQEYWEWWISRKAKPSREQYIMTVFHD